MKLFFKISARFLEANMTRREFLGFFLLGGFLSLFAKKLKVDQKLKKAMFWKKTDAD